MESITIKACFPEKRHMDEFIRMMAWMELCGNIGHSSHFVVTVDGDGDARPNFIFETDGMQEKYDKTRKRYIMNEYKSAQNHRGSDFDRIDISFDIA